MSNRLANAVREATRRFDAAHGRPDAKKCLASPAKPLKFTPGWTRKLVKSRRDDGTHLDRDEARATLRHEPYARFLRYVGGSRDGLWFEYDPRRLRK